MTGEEKDLLKKYLTHLNVLGPRWEPSPLRGLVPGGPLRPGPKRPTQPDGSLRTALQGCPRRRPGIQSTAGEHQVELLKTSRAKNQPIQ